MEHPLKLTTQVWTDTSLFAGVAYDQAEASDHFFKDSLRSMAEQLATVDGAMSLSAFKAAVAEEDHPYIDVFRFVDGLNRSETRHRHDRVTCAQLVLITTLNRFGYDFQGTDDEATRQVIGYVREPAVLRNLVAMIKRMRLDSDHEFRRLIASIDEARVPRT